MNTTTIRTITAQSQHRGQVRQRGFNLVELMIALVLGLLVVGGALSIFVANQQTYSTTESLGRIQENTRTAFELMSRELREAGGNPCGKNLPAPGNTVNGANAGLNWALAFGSGLTGFDGGQALAVPSPPAAGVGSRIAGTDAFDIKSAAGTGITVVAHNPVAAQFQLNDPNRPFRPGDILMVCDFRQAAIFQMTGPAGVNATVVHNAGAGAPGNCSKGLGVPTDCSSANGRPYTYGANSTVARLAASRWYIGDNGRVSGNGGNGRALFRSTLRAGALANEEVVEGVTDMQVTYLLQNAAAYVPAAAVPAGQWDNVTAANVTLTLAGQAQGETRISTTGGALQRQVNFVVNLRNRSI